MPDERAPPNPIDVHVGERVAAYRKVAGLSQEALGNAIGVTFQQSQKYEKGTNRIGASRLFEISRFLDVPLSVFFKGLEGSPSAAQALDPDRSDPTCPHAREGIELLRAFTAIPDPKVRADVVALVRSVAALTPSNGIRSDRG